MRASVVYFILLAVIMQSCTAVEKTSRQQLESGIYKVSTENNKRFYTVVTEKDITLFPASRVKGDWSADSARSIIIPLDLSATTDRRTTRFTSSTFDLDIITIIFKYRPGVNGFPRQLNTNFNAAGFMGFRTDRYILSHNKSPLNTYQYRINHFAYSVGGFAGIGATAMNPFVTTNNISSEYDGLVLTKGVAGLVGVGQFTFGATLGFDNLLDKNRKSWIYENKCWFGFAVGFNIN